MRDLWTFRQIFDILCGIITQNDTKEISQGSP
jgi:hypothetical protein